MLWGKKKKNFHYLDKYSYYSLPYHSRSEGLADAYHYFELRQSKLRSIYCFSDLVSFRRLKTSIKHLKCKYLRLYVDKGNYSYGPMHCQEDNVMDGYRSS